MSEKLFSSADIAAIESLHKCSSSNFVDLAKAAGLKPDVDFKYVNLRDIDVRGCDLATFDFTGSDLRGAIKSPSTILPPIKCLENTLVQWIERDDTPQIVQLMTSIEVSDGQAKSKLISRLNDEYDSEDHIDRFAYAGFMKARLIAEARDYYSCLSSGFLIRREIEVAETVSKILERERKRAKPRKKVGARDNYSEVSGLIGWLAQSDMAEVSEFATLYRSGEITMQTLIARLKELRTKPLL